MLLLYNCIYIYIYIPIVSARPAKLLALFRIRDHLWLIMEFNGLTIRMVRITGRPYRNLSRRIVSDGFSLDFPLTHPCYIKVAKSQTLYR